MGLPLFSLDSQAKNSTIKATYCLHKFSVYKWIHRHYINLLLCYVESRIRTLRSGGKSMMLAGVVTTLAWVTLQQQDLTTTSPTRDHCKYSTWSTLTLYLTTVSEREWLHYTPSSFWEVISCTTHPRNSVRVANARGGSRFLLQQKRTEEQRTGVTAV